MKKILSLALSVLLIIGVLPIVSAAGVDSSLKSDYVPGSMPENIFTGSSIVEFNSGVNYNHYNQMHKGDAAVITHEVGISQPTTKSVMFKANRDLPDPNAVFAKNEQTGYHEWDGVNYNYSWPLSGCSTKSSLLQYPGDYGNLVFSFDAYNSSSSEVDINGARINIGRFYKHRTESVNTNEYPIEYNGKDEGFVVTVNSTEPRQKFSGTFIDTNKYKLSQYLYSIGMPQGTPKGASVTLDSVYFGIEEVYDIEVAALNGTNIAPSTGGNIKLSAKILNQIGSTGGLEQGNFTWHALNLARTEYVQGITVTPGNDGTATVAVSRTVPVGKYTIVAVSDTYEGFVKGIEINIGYEDYIPGQLPRNYISEDATAKDLLAMNYNKYIKLPGETSTLMDVIVSEKDDGKVVLKAQRNLTKPNEVYMDSDNDGHKDTLKEGEQSTEWAFSGATTSSSVLQLPAQKGALVYSFKVSNNDTAYTPKINFGRNKKPLYSAEYNGTDKGMEVLASGGRWQVFSGTIPADENNLNDCSYSIGLAEGSPKGSSVTIKADEMYFGIEEVYDIEVSTIGSDRVSVGMGGTITVDADITNQVYSTGDLEQGEFLWYALNDDRTETVPGITVTAGENGTATVNVAPTVPCGAYDIVASAVLYPGFVKGVRIYVVLPEDVEAEGMSQHIARDFSELRSLTFSRNEIKHIDSTLYFENSSGPLANSKVLTVKPTSAGGMALFDIRTEAGNKYNISAWVRADSAADNGYFVFTNKAQDGGADVVNEVHVTHAEPFESGKWVYVTAEYFADGRGVRGTEKVGAMLSGTIGFRFGNDSTVSYAIDDLFVFPEVNNKLDYDDVFTLGSFDTDACLDEWYVWANEGGTLTEEQQKTNGFSYDGYRNVPGALELDGIRMFDAIRPYGAVDIEYGRAYRMSFYAKALDNEAVGQRIWFYMGYSDIAGDGFDPVFSKFHHVNNGQNPTLTNEWQYFEIDFDYDFIARNLAEMTMGFRVSDLQNVFLTKGGRPHYMIDNVSLKQIGGEDFIVSADIYGDVASNDGATIKLNYLESTKGSFVYRIVKEAINGDHVLKSGAINEETIDFSYKDSLDEVSLRLDLIGTDAYGNYSQFFSMPIEVTQKSHKITFEPDNYFWNDDIDTLRTTLTFENNAELKNLNVYTAFYSGENRLIGLNKAEVSAVPNEKNEFTVSVDTANLDAGQSPVAKAKFFVWHTDSYAPVTCSDEIEKSVGEFIYVDANSTSATENGTFTAPFKTISDAVAKLESIVSTTSQKNIYVVLKSGEYIQPKAIDLSTTASSSDKNIVFTTIDGEKAKISGANRVTGFTEYENGIYRAPVPNGTMSRQFYVNGIKATRARSVEDVEGFKNLDTTEATTFTNSGLSCTDTSYVNYKYPSELELVFIENWNHYYIMPDSITESEGKALFTFNEEGNADAWKRLMTKRVLSATVPVYVENALELLDEPGEWYLDTHDNYIYYMPRCFEDINTAEFILPVTEQLVVASGTADNPVKNLKFSNIEFCYSAWNYPTTKRYFAPTQALYYQNLNMNSYDGGDEIIEGTLHFNNVHNLSFNNCDFAHLGGNALVMVGAVQNCDVIGNEFYEISGNAINMGDVNNGAYAPSHEKYFVKDNEISNNYIHKIADDYYSGAGIVAGYPINTVIRNNEIADAPYCGIHTGWGWATTATGCTENLVIENNYIHNTMNWRLYDGAPIYVVGRTNGTDHNPNLIRGNYIADTKNPIAGIYPDDGSTYWNISQNVIDASLYPRQYHLKESAIGYASWLNVWTSRITNIVAENNYSTTSHYRYEGSNGSFEQAEIYPGANWNESALAIIDKAGIEDEYLDKFEFDIQMLTLPQRVTISVGATENLYYNAETTKGAKCDLTDCEITVKSSNESVATVTDKSIVGLSEGKAWITFAVCKKDKAGKVTYYDEFMFCVVVE